MSPVHNPGRTKKRLTERLRLATSRIPCFLWADQLGSEPLHGLGFVSDISEEGAGIYLNVGLPKATPVRLAFGDEANEPYHGVIHWVRRYNLQQRFHSQATLDHRVGVHLRFDTESDRQRYLMYFNELRKRATFLNGEFKF